VAARAAGSKGQHSHIMRESRCWRGGANSDPEQHRDSLSDPGNRSELSRLRLLLPSAQGSTRAFVTSINAGSRRLGSLAVRHNSSQVKLALLWPNHDVAAPTSTKPGLRSARAGRALSQRPSHATCNRSTSATATTNRPPHSCQSANRVRNGSASQNRLVERRSAIHHLLLRA